MWQTISTILRKQDAITKTLNLKCHLHGKVAQINNLEDFHQVSNGGCGEYCDKELPCGHLCKVVCPLKHSHEYYCIEICGR